MLEHLSETDHELALKVVDHVDTVDIHPTTVLYLQSNYKTRKHNQNVKYCIHNLVADCSRLDRFHQSTIQHKGRRELSGLTVTWPEDSTTIPAFPILDDRVYRSLENH
jgi:hypothetical protein